MQLTKCWSDESDSNSLTFGGLRGSNKKCDWIKLKIPRMFVNFTKLIWLDNRRLRWEDRSRAHMWCDLVSNGIGNVTRVVSFDLRYWRLETYTERRSLSFFLNRTDIPLRISMDQIHEAVRDSSNYETRSQRLEIELNLLEELLRHLQTQTCCSLNGRIRIRIDFKMLCTTKRVRGNLNRLTTHLRDEHRRECSLSGFERMNEKC